MRCTIGHIRLTTRWLSANILGLQWIQANTSLCTAKVAGSNPAELHAPQQHVSRLHGYIHSLHQCGRKPLEDLPFVVFSSGNICISRNAREIVKYVRFLYTRVQLSPIAVGLIIAVIIGIVVVAAGCSFFPGAANIPADHKNRTTCFECHQTGIEGAAKMPRGHQDKIRDGRLSDNVTSCLPCHKFAG